MNNLEPLDSQSESLLHLLAEQERIRANRVPSVRTVLVVLSSRALAYDTESLRQKILLAYPDAAVFFRTTNGKPAGLAAPEKVDLLIDLTPPGARQGLFYARKLRRIARVAVGRNAGLFRRSLYDHVYDEKAKAAELPKDLLARERVVQREVLALAGVPLARMGDTPADRGNSIALELPSMRRL